MVGLGSLPGYAVTSADRAVSGDGSIVVGSSISQAFRYILLEKDKRN